jgi:YhcH/YjgK/YiaL family protein
MTIDLINNLSNYSFLHKSIESFCEFLKGNSLSEINEKIITKDFDIIPILNDSNLDIDIELLEAHRKQIDIHIILEGNDIIAFKNLSENLDIYREYDDENDYLLVKSGKLNTISLESGYFCFIPNHFAHMALYGTKSKCRKVVIKLK